MTMQGQPTQGAGTFTAPTIHTHAAYHHIGHMYNSMKAGQSSNPTEKAKFQSTATAHLGHLKKYEGQGAKLSPTAYKDAARYHPPHVMDAIKSLAAFAKASEVSQDGRSCNRLLIRLNKGKSMLQKTNKEDEGYRAPITQDVDKSDADKGARLSPGVGPMSKTAEAAKACSSVSKMIGGPSVGPGAVPTAGGPSVGMGKGSDDGPGPLATAGMAGGPAGAVVGHVADKVGGAVGGAVSSVATGAANVANDMTSSVNKGDADKAYLGEAKIPKPGEGGSPEYSGSGIMPRGTKVGGKRDAVIADIQGGKDGEGSKIPTTGKIKEGTGPDPSTKFKVTTSGGGNTGTKTGTDVLTSTFAKPKTAKVDGGLKPGSELSMESVAQKKVASLGKAMEALVEKAHGGKGPASTGTTPFDDFQNHGGKGPANKTCSCGFCHAGKGPAKTGAGEHHESGRPDGTTQHKAAVHEPGRPGGTSAHKPMVHAPGRPLNKAVTARSVPQMPRAMAAQLDTWRSGTAVMNPTNSRFAGSIQPYQLDGGAIHSIVPSEVAKSTYNTCGTCGRTYMAKSFPAGCPGCMVSKAHQCDHGHQLSKSRDGSYKCLVCG